MQDLVDHMHEFHPLDSCDRRFECHYCEQSFKSRREMMIHRKLMHKEKVKVCFLFNEGKCDYKDSCWFSHEISETELPEYNCNYCEKTFRNKSAFMKHMKKTHIRCVQLCKDYKNNGCHYGETNCWFKHENENISDDINIVEIKNQNEMMQKLFEMVETYTQRIISLESELRN